MKNIIVVSGSRGIGLSLVKKCLDDSSETRLITTFRGANVPSDLVHLQNQHLDRLHLVSFDAEIESSYQNLTSTISDLGIDTVDLAICSLGLLHSRDHMPERKLEELDFDFLRQVFTINTFSVAMLAAQLKPFLRKAQAPIFAAISAKVGSIEDNKMGGWYSYRSSKAALNMMIKNISIEMARFNRNFVAVSIHPGTTETGLSEPFQTGARKKYQVHSPDETAQNILSVIAGLKPQDSGLFYSWDGTILPW